MRMIIIYILIITYESLVINSQIMINKIYQTLNENDYHLQSTYILLNMRASMHFML